MGSFSKNYDYVANAITTECEVYASHTNQQPYCTKNAAWDTGSTNTVISMEIVRKLGLKQIGTAHVGGFGGGTTAPTFLVDLGLPTEDVVLEIEVIGDNSMEDYNVLIGMDIIGLGDFAITNKENQTVFAFRIPSEEHIKFD